MNVVLTVFICALAYNSIGAVPPEVCFAGFNWDDCGKPPTPVIYYSKLGSRCEVAMWRGCLPNMNMFENEYECVSTCIFTERARPEDYHQHNEIESDLEDIVITTTTTEFAKSTIGEDIGNYTDTAAAPDGDDEKGNSTSNGETVETHTAAEVATTVAEER